MSARTWVAVASIFLFCCSAYDIQVVSLTPGDYAAACLSPFCAHSGGYTAPPSSCCMLSLAVLHELFVLFVFVQPARLGHHPLPQTQGRPNQAGVQGGLDSCVPADTHTHIHTIYVDIYVLGYSIDIMNNVAN